MGSIHGDERHPGTRRTLPRRGHAHAGVPARASDRRPGGPAARKTSGPIARGKDDAGRQVPSGGPGTVPGIAIGHGGCRTRQISAVGQFRPSSATARISRNRSFLRSGCPRRAERAAFWSDQWSSRREARPKHLAITRGVQEGSFSEVRWAHRSRRRCPGAGRGHFDGHGTVRNSGVTLFAGHGRRCPKRCSRRASRSTHRRSTSRTACM